MTETIENKQREHLIFRVTLVGSFINFLLLLFKFVAGVLGGSAAMIADAVHSLSDFVTDLIVVLFVRISGKPCDADHDFGHGKYETLATASIGLMLLAVGLGILWNGACLLICFRSCSCIWHKKHRSPRWWMPTCRSGRSRRSLPVRP